MTVSALEHVTIRCAQLRRTRDFYVDLMGLSEGPRPDFPFRGHWLYLGEVPVVHLVEAADKGSAWGGEPGAAGGDTGPFDHVAFRGDDLWRHARQAGRGRHGLPGTGGAGAGALAQLFARDPEGVLVEINFRTG